MITTTKNGQISVDPNLSCFKKLIIDMERLHQILVVGYCKCKLKS